jgi:hypothetical protein
MVKTDILNQLQIEINNSQLGTLSDMRPLKVYKYTEITNINSNIIGNDIFRSKDLIFFIDSWKKKFNLTGDYDKIKYHL